MILRDVPHMGLNAISSVRRFIILIDNLYDHQVRERKENTLLYTHVLTFNWLLILVSQFSFIKASQCKYKNINHNFSVFQFFWYARSPFMMTGLGVKHASTDCIHIILSIAVGDRLKFIFISVRTCINHGIHNI